MEDVAGAVGIHHAIRRYLQRRKNAFLPGLVVPDEAVLAERNAADPTAARTQIAEHLARREVHLFAQTFGHYRHVDKSKKLVRIGAQAAAIQRGKYAGLATRFRVMDRGIGLMSIDMQSAAALEIEWRKRMDVMVVATPHDRPLPCFRHDE